MGRLAATVCECGQVFLPPRERCVKCTCPTRPVDINDTGRILSYTVLQVTPEGFDPPLIVGLIEMDPDGECVSSDLEHPRLVCEGKMPESELGIDLEVRVKKIDEKYYFVV